MVFHWIALLCFVAAFVLHWIFVKKKTYLSRRKSYPIICVGFASLTVFLLQRGMSIHACPIGNPFEIVTFIVWSSVFFYLTISLLFSVNYLGFFTAGLASIILLSVLLFPGLNYAYSPEDLHTSYIVGVHASLAVFSYGIFALLSLLGVMYLVQFYGLARHRVGSFFSILPPLVKLERLETWILSIGVFVLSVSLFIGSFSFFREIGDIPTYKLTATMFVWAFYTSVLFLKLIHRLVASRFAWMVLLGFVVALVALVPVDRARQEMGGFAPSAIEE